MIIWKSAIIWLFKTQKKLFICDWRELRFNNLHMPLEFLSHNLSIISVRFTWIKWLHICWGQWWFKSAEDIGSRLPQWFPYIAYFVQSFIDWYLELLIHASLSFVVLFFRYAMQLPLLVFWMLLLSSQISISIAFGGILGLLYSSISQLSHLFDWLNAYILA